LPLLPRTDTIVEILTSSSGFRTVVVEAAQANLAVFRGLTDQFIEGNKPAEFALPYDAFVHTRAEATVTLVAKLANGDDLPVWIQFDARSGTFQMDPPRGYQDELQIMVVARDTEGREATTLFRLTVGEVKGKVSSRPGLSEQIRLAAHKSGPWLDLVRPQNGKVHSDGLVVNRFAPAGQRTRA
jgi:hypothetical protein